MRGMRSTAEISFARALRRLRRLNGFAEKETVRVGNGCYHAVIDPKNALAVRMFENGVREIERMYPAHVKFIKQEDF